MQFSAVATESWTNVSCNAANVGFEQNFVTTLPLLSVNLTTDRRCVVKASWEKAAVDLSAAAGKARCVAVTADSLSTNAGISFYEWSVESTTSKGEAIGKQGSVGIVYPSLTTRTELMANLDAQGRFPASWPMPCCGPHLAILRVLHAGCIVPSAQCLRLGCPASPALRALG